MQSQPISINRRRVPRGPFPPQSSLPLSELEMNVLFERRWFALNRRRSAPGWVARELGITRPEVIAIEAEADTKLRAARPISDLTGIDTSAGPGYLLWRLSRLEDFALIGVHGHDDVRDDESLRTADDDAGRVAYNSLVPDDIQLYAKVLQLRARQRHETREVPSLPELEHRRWQWERDLIELWRGTVLPASHELSAEAYPPTMPLANAEAHLRWLAAEIEQLRERAATRLGRSIR